MNTSKTTKNVVFSIAATLIISCGTMLSSCQKEYIDKYNIIPGDTIQVSGLNHIVSFSLNEFGDDIVIKASITADDSIFVYWPVYKAFPEEIIPEIIVSEKASITPASGTAIPFVPLATDTRYTVKAEDGTERIYTLKVIPKQEPPTMSTGASTVFNKTSNITVTGVGHLTDISKIRVVLETLDKSATYEADVNRVRVQDIRFKASEDTPLGQYKIKVTSGYATTYVHSSGSPDNDTIITLQ